MNIKELKSHIEKNTLDNTMLVFKYTDNDFVATQYYRQIAISKHLLIDTIDFSEEDDDILNIVHSIVLEKEDIFGFNDYSDTLRILRVDEFNTDTDKLMDIENLIIICTKINKNVSSIYNERIIEFPALEDWQVKDYIASMVSGINNKQTEWLFNSCRNDIKNIEDKTNSYVYRIQNEIDKLSIFSEKERPIRFNDFINDGVYGDLNQSNAFNFINALMKKDFTTIRTLYKSLEDMGLNGMGFAALLYNNLKNVITVQLTPKATPENCNMKSGQFWAIKNNVVDYYDKNQLLRIFDIVTNIEYLVMENYISVDSIIDYIMVKMLTI